MIQIQNIQKSFETTKALNKISFDIKVSEICGLVGPNGAGKSTLFKIIMGLLEQDTGEIIIDDIKIFFGDTDYKQLIGYAPEEPVLYEYLTGVEFLQFIAAAKQMPPDIRTRRIGEWLDFFSLTPKANELVKNYSQGMRRKLSLIAALFTEPKILLLDEATNGLDPSSSYKFKEYLKKFCAGGGTVLFSTHIIETAEHLCDRIIILNKGNIIKQLIQKDWKHLRDNNSSLELLFMSLVDSESKV